MGLKQTILLIEDETDIMQANQELLESAGYSVQLAENLKKGWVFINSSVPNLIVLDVMLPDGSGLDFCKRIRERYTVPILFLTCRNEQKHIIEGLKYGGDDYMTKPYNMEEFLLRCRAILRRSETSNTPDIFHFSTLSLDIIQQKAYLRGEDTHLTPKEFALLLFFLKNPSKGFTAAELFESVWGISQVDDVRTVKVHIFNLRKKLMMDENSEVAINVSDRKHYICNLYF